MAFNWLTSKLNPAETEDSAKQVNQIHSPFLKVGGSLLASALEAG